MASGGISGISGETLERARKELNEEPDKRAEAIQELKERIDQWERNPPPEEAGLTFARKDESFLLRFLRARKFDLDRALQLYINFYRYRQKYADKLTDYNPRSVEHILKSGAVRVLDKRLRNGAKVICLFPHCWDYENVPFGDNFKTLMLTLDKLIEDEETQVNGIAIFNNLEGVSFFQIMKLVQSEQMEKGMVIELLQDAFPARFKGFHLINQPWYVSIVLAIMRPFMKSKLRSRFRIHGAEMSGLHEFIEPENLPEDFGGPQPALDPYSSLKLFEDELSGSSTQ